MGSLLNNTQLTTGIKLTEHATIMPRTLYKLRVDNKVVYISFRHSMRFIVADVQVGNNHKKFSYYDNKPLLPQVSKRQWVNGVFMHDIVKQIADREEEANRMEEEMMLQVDQEYWDEYSRSM